MLLLSQLHSALLNFERWGWLGTEAAGWMHAKVGDVFIFAAWLIHRRPVSYLD
jgi:hypothetical protein